MTRMEQARQRVRTTRYAIGISAAAALAAFAAAARYSHPGTHHATAVSGTAGAATAQPTYGDDDGTDYGDSFFYGDDSQSSTGIGPSGSATPQIQSGAS